MGLGRARSRGAINVTAVRLPLWQHVLDIGEKRVQCPVYSSAASGCEKMFAKMSGESMLLALRATGGGWHLL